MKELSESELDTTFNFNTRIPFMTRSLYLLESNPKVLSTLIKDRSANRPIFFGTDNYESISKTFSENSRMGVGMMRHFLVDEDRTIFQPRAQKDSKIKASRTKKRGEVLTPLWIVNQMIDLLDEEWKELSLNEYLSQTVLELCCGEAPFLVQRYDSISGDLIPVAQRRGILDRKLHRTSKSTKSKKTWMDRAYQAYRTTYGYEYQGDSLFLGRENLLFDFVEHYFDKFHELPSINEINNIATIISWNLFQMDGLKNEVPYFDPHQQQLFGTSKNPHTKPLITLWESKGHEPKTKEKRRYGDEEMKFDVVIGNPAYQEEKEEAGRQAPPLYHRFTEEAKKVTKDNLSLIIPSRWFSGGIGLDDFRNNMLNDHKIVRITDYTNSKDVFSDQSISGGVNFFVWKKDYIGDCLFTNITNGISSTMKRDLSEFSIFVRYNQAVDAIHKIRSKTKDTISDITSSLMPFGLPTNYRGRKEKSEEDTITLYTSKGISYIREDEIKKGKDILDSYGVLVGIAASEHAGEPAKDGKFRVIPKSMKVIGPHEAVTHSYFVVGNFAQEEEAKNLYKYLKTKLVRFLILMSMSSFHLSQKTFIFVPIQDFSNYSDIQWDSSIENIDEQLFNKYELTQEEIVFINSLIKEMI